MTYYTVKLPHFGAKPGAILRKYIATYTITLRHCKGLIGLYPCFEDDATYALFRRQSDALTAYTALINNFLEEVELTGAKQVDENKIRSMV